VAIVSSCAADPPAAVVGIVVKGCDPGEENGSGMIVEPGLVLTSAHVLAGARQIAVLDDGVRVPGTIVAFDPEMDIAYLSIADRTTAPMSIASDHVRAGDNGVAYVVRGGEPVTLPIRILRRARIHTEDIYIQGETVRAGFELDADIRAGDSGGAVMIDGEVVGVLWARSSKRENRAWAIDPVRSGDLVREQLRTGAIGDDIDLARCR
jgi:S1-C subfamily serine protease